MTGTGTQTQTQTQTRTTGVTTIALLVLRTGELKTEMSYTVSGKNKKTITSLSSAESANRVLKINFSC